MATGTPKQPLILAQGGGNRMWTTIKESAPEGTYQFALNMLPLDADDPNSAMRQRAGFVNLGTSGLTHAAAATGQLQKGDGTSTTWVLTVDDGIWTYNWGSSTWTNTVTAANLATATISILAITGGYYWCGFNNTIVFNDYSGTYKPWTWDGTAGVGGLVKLTNAPNAYGAPTVYYSKLFFIKASDRRSISWSEELTANTGYEAGGYTNVWVLGQSSSAPLTAIHGTNEALYYFRADSIGVIRGAVNTDFTTSGTHDAVSSTLGNVAYCGPAEMGGELWFYDQNGLPAVMPIGGVPQSVFRGAGIYTGTSTDFSADVFGGFNLSIQMASREFQRVVAVPPLFWLPYETIWFWYATPGGSVALVVAKQSRAPLGWVYPYQGGAGTGATASLVYDTTNKRWLPSVADFSTGRPLVPSGFGRADLNGAGTPQSTVLMLVTSPLVANPVVDMQFDQAYVLGMSNASLTSLLYVLTSRFSYASVSTAQNVTLSITNALGFSNYIPNRQLVGTTKAGRWGRLIFSTTIPANTTEYAAHLAGWGLVAYPLSGTVKVP